MSKLVLTTGKRLQRWRTAAGMTQAEAARVFRCTLDAYSKWERDAAEPRGRGTEYGRHVAKLLVRYEAVAGLEV